MLLVFGITYLGTFLLEHDYKYILNQQIITIIIIIRYHDHDSISV